MPSRNEADSGDVVPAVAGSEGLSKDGDRQPSFRLGRGARILLLSLPTLITLAVGVFVAEWFARTRAQEIAGSDALDQGLTVHDETLGWKLTPLWSGQHRHYDYAATYHTSRLGFRNDSPDLASVQHPWYAVLGDSFVFGFGVNDDQTFVHLLNKSAGNGPSYVNFAVPGYSTDQETLLLEERILAFKPDVVLLVVYLGNDILDNPRSYPMQARRAKPYFVPAGAELDLRNTPVPQTPSPTPDSQDELRKAVLGAGADHLGTLDRLASNSFLLSSLRERYDGASLSVAEMRDRFAPALELFQRIIVRAERDATQRGARLTLVLLAGRSFVETPKSLSAVYQECLRQSVMDWTHESGIPTIDVAGIMRDQYAQSGGRWYFMNDGHLTPEGHARVAAILANELQLPVRQ
jgi:hypothetical protein